MTDILKAKEILAKSLELPIQKISDTAELSSLEQLDSLSFERLVFEIERSLGHEVDVMDLLQLRSVSDLAKLLAKG